MSKVKISTAANGERVPPSKKRKLDTQTPQDKISATSLPARTSKRLNTVAATAQSPVSIPTKSKYFEHNSVHEEEDDDDDDDDNAGEEVESGYEDEDASMTQESESSVDDDEYDSEEESRTKKRRKSKSNNSTTSHVLAGKNDLWREGVKTGLGPGKQVFIEKPKARGDGGIKYKPDRLHPNTLEFLRDLKKNNDRTWLKAHDPDYRQSWKDFESFLEVLTERIIEVDETIPELPPKDVVFRIYRDVRFSSDPTPYKPHFSAAFSRTGRKGPYACYYLHVQPDGKCFVGSGLWHPDAQPIALLRKDISEHPERIKAVLTNASIRKSVFGGISKDEKKAVKALCAQNTDNALKTKPKGYEADHPEIDLLRLRNFTMGSKISDTDMVSAHGMDKVVELVRTMQPWVAYLNNVVMPDGGNDENDDEENSEVTDEDSS